MTGLNFKGKNKIKPLSFENMVQGVGFRDASTVTHEDLVIISQAKIEAAHSPG